MSVFVHAARGNEFRVPSADVGTTVDLTGEWSFKPTGDDKEYSVPVPQMLSRIQWWLDDSEDFKKWEQARLDKLGFNTDKVDDGTYRLTFDCPQLPPDRHLWIEFDGVAMKCKSSINGHELGEHAGMFSRFAYDLTEHLKPGKNELTVWASMEKVPPSDAKLGEAVTVNLSAAKVISMSKGMFGPLAPNQNNRAYDLLGIWQPVKLVVRGPAMINDVFFQSLPDLNGAKVAVEVQSTGLHGNVRVRARFTDPKAPGGAARFELSQSATLAGLAHVTLQGAGMTGIKPWTPADPTLYRLEVTLQDPQGKVLDQWAHRVGFRTFEVKGNQLLLNGKPYWLRGANQLPYGKNPWDPRLAKKLIGFLHDGHINFTRTHATPWNEAWLDAADEIGLGVSIEGIRPWAFAGKAEEGGETLMPPPAIFQHWLVENEDVIKRCRNHPSVFIWTVGNEMNLRDGKNLEKWKLLSEVVKQTRSLDPTRPVVASSSYYRENKFYNEQMKPAGIDDGDIDDIHAYNGWYSDSNFAVDSKFAKEMKENQHRRPLIGQEVATGYPDLDTGLPCLRYTRDLLTPQAWVGNWAYPGNDPAIWLDHHAKVTKRWAEQLRFQRGSNTAGFSLFSAECWFHHSYDPDSAEPYPVYDAVKQAFAPLGIALETTQRRFYGGQEVSTNLYITNDDDHAAALDDLKIAIGDNFSGRQAVFDRSNTTLAHIDYYETKKVPIRFKLQDVQTRSPLRLVVQIYSREKQVGETSDAIEIFPKPVESPAPPPSGVVVVKPGESLAGVREKTEAGATVIVFSPANKAIAGAFPDDYFDDAAEREKERKATAAKAAARAATRPKKPVSTKPAASQPAEEKKGDIIEFADFSPCAGTKLVENLQPMDLKWWARKDDWRAMIGSTSQRLKPGGKARELIRYIPPHSYIAKEKIPEQYRVVLSEVPVGKGRVWVCDLDIDASADIDPAARIFADNLFRAAADPDSTKNLPNVPSHEELLRGGK